MLDLPGSLAFLPQLNPNRSKVYHASAWEFAGNSGIERRGEEKMGLPIPSRNTFYRPITIPGI